MKSIHLYCFLAFLTILGACKQNTSVQDENNKQDSASENTNTTSPADKGTMGHDYTFLTDKMLIYAGAVTAGDRTEQVYKGQWVDLDPDGTYRSGKYADQVLSGLWQYNHDTQILLLRPNESDVKITEWKVQHNDDMLVWVGTSTYNDNATQVKLVRGDKYPEKE